MNMNLKNKYFLFDDGTLYYAPKGIDPKFTQETEDEGTKVALYSFSGLGFSWRGIVASSNSLAEIEEKEEQYFYLNAFLINDFYKALTGKKHTFSYEKWGGFMPKEHIETLRNLNRVKLVEQMIQFSE